MFKLNRAEEKKLFISFYLPKIYGGGFVIAGIAILLPTCFDVWKSLPGARLQIVAIGLLSLLIGTLLFAKKELCFDRVTWTVIRTFRLGGFEIEQPSMLSGFDKVSIFEGRTRTGKYFRINLESSGKKFFVGEFNTDDDARLVAKAIKEFLQLEQ